MTLTIQEISDRIEINDLLIRYCTVVDARDWDAFGEIFTADAIVDYSAMGGSRGGLKQTVEYLRKAMPGFVAHQHMIANSAVQLSGDTATARTMCHNPMVLGAGGDGTHVFFCGLWYCDKLVRTPEGWRIAERIEEKSYFHNLPADFQPAEVQSPE